MQGYKAGYPTEWMYHFYKSRLIEKVYPMF